MVIDTIWTDEVGGVHEDNKLKADDERHIHPQTQHGVPPISGPRDEEAAQRARVLHKGLATARLSY